MKIVTKYYERDMFDSDIWHEISEEEFSNLVCEYRNCFDCRYEGVNTVIFTFDNIDMFKRVRVNL